MRELITYGLVGIANTFVGMGLIFLATYIGIFAELSNFIGYFFGIIFSYFLNSKFTFKESCSYKGLIKFFVAMGISYGVNLLVLILCYRIFEINVYISQFIACASYTLCGFILSKVFIFSTKKLEQPQ